ncbi:hypothetical protein HK097_006043 [Rhizophlyctis rosea]|uniref:Uncharacterized protein n=1 Tax=Rhizophlyctis rosea TaxID=64517 RepID=A0AAD5SEL5_9FUNG|nr:hypothetical protein HK097_006043 [Rhizophlyctis rosea]
MSFEVGGEIEVKKFIQYDPVIAKVIIKSGTVTKGDYIPQIGQVIKISDDGEEIEEAKEREKPWIITTHVSDDMFKELMPHLQFKILLTLGDRMHKLTQLAYNKHGLDNQLCEGDEDPHKDESVLERFMNEYMGGAKKIKMPIS